MAAIVEERSAFPDWVLCANFLFQYPIYSMLWCLSIYFSLLYFGNNICRSLLLLYLAYIVVWDQSPRLSGRWNENETLREFARSAFPFRLMKQFVNVELILDGNLKKKKDKKQESDKKHKQFLLDPKKPYLFLYHPHGIIGIGCNTALTTNACNFDQIFPGIIRSTCTLNASFLVPFYREWMLMNGLISANKATIIDQLKRKRSIVLVPGGASEALYAHPNEYVFVLKQRKGFIKLALLTGASIIPVIGFGENELFHTLSIKKTNKAAETGDGSLHTTSSLFWLQMKLKGMLSFSFPIATHIFPIRRSGQKISVVVGEPINIPIETKPTQKSIDKYHTIYCNSIQQLFDRNIQKSEHNQSKNVKLSII